MELLIRFYTEVTLKILALKVSLKKTGIKPRELEYVGHYAMIRPSPTPLPRLH